MEKKGIRSLQSSSRGPSTDSKKNQDGISGRPWPRGGRRREPQNANQSKPEPSRTQRIRTSDKRPKPRGGYFGTGSDARTSQTRLEDQEPQLGSVFLPGSKKQSLNHLLNFNYTPRDGFPSEKAHPKGSNRLIATRKHKYNKEHFLQANCQFVVNGNGNYKQYLNNPDALVDWTLIEQVNVQVSEFPSCPICLYPPVAAKMTRCGHIYCWPCVLHYLALSDKAWRKCPICFEAIHKKDLKSVVAIPHTTFNVNETIQFKLMKRAKGSLIAYPANATVKDDFLNMSETDSGDVYSKLVLANQQNILSIIERESNELQCQLAEDETSPERCFNEQATTLLKEREVVVLDSVDEAERKCELQQDLENLDISNNIQLPKFHYFYQASDGQHIYLHAINARMLEHSYGSLEFGPKTVTGKILEKEGGSMTEDLRNRLRYLQHLPVTCQFEVAEIQLRQPVVSKETIEEFQEQVEIRRKIRQRRAKEEKRREKRIAEEENRQMGKFPLPDIHLESHLQFPEFGFEARLRTESECTQPSERSSSPELNIPSSNENFYAGPSFATMLAIEKRTPNWPNIKSQTSTTVPLKLINVTGAKMKSTSQIRMHSDSDVELDDYEPVPSFHKSFGDAVAQALLKAEEVEEEVPAIVGKKKKKKNKQKVLFTTNMAYSG